MQTIPPLDPASGKINFLSEDWRVIKAAIQRQIEAQKDICLNAQTEKQADKARGAVEALMHLLHMERRPA